MLSGLAPGPEFVAVNDGAAVAGEGQIRVQRLK